MGKLVRGFYKDGEWYTYGKLYDTVGYNEDGAMTQRAINECIGGVLELVSGYSLAIRVHGDADCSNLAPFYFVTNGDLFSIRITYTKPAIALNIISIIMGETDITSTAYDDGVISIDSVTGNVTITVETSSVTDETPFYERVTANGINVLNPTALFKEVRGFSGTWTNYNLAGAYTINGWKSKTIDGNYFKGYMIAATSSTKYYMMTFTIVSQVVGIKIYVCADVKVTTASLSVARWGIGLTTGSGNVSGSNYGTYHAANEWFHHETILSTYIVNDNSYYRNVMFCTVGRKTGSTYNNYSEDDYVEIKNVKVVNLTALFGAGNEPTTPEQFREMFPLDDYDRSTGVVLNNTMTNYISKDGNGETLQNVPLNVTTLTGKLNGEGESVVVFPNGLKSSCNEAVNDTYDEIKQVDGVWKAIKRIGTERATSAISGRGEYEILAQEEVYILDDQTIPTRITVADQGTEVILPTNGTTPTTAPVPIVAQYGAIPSRGLLGGGLTRGGGSDNGGYESEEPAEELDDIDEKLGEELDEELGENSNDETEEETKEDVDKPMPVVEKQELKK